MAVWLTAKAGAIMKAGPTKPETASIHQGINALPTTNDARRKKGGTGKECVSMLAKKILNPKWEAIFHRWSKHEI
jgi:hypothetical protein